MRGTWMTGVIAGGIIGATAGLYALNKMSPRRRKMLMKRGSKVMQDASHIMSMRNVMNMF